jgi:hypothetical protein
VEQSNNCAALLALSLSQARQTALTEIGIAVSGWQRSAIMNESFWMGVLLSATVITIILLIGTLLSVIGIVSGW